MYTCAHLALDFLFILWSSLKKKRDKERKKGKNHGTLKKMDTIQTQVHEIGSLATKMWEDFGVMKWT